MVKKTLTEATNVSSTEDGTANGSSGKPAIKLATGKPAAKPATGKPAAKPPTGKTTQPTTAGKSAKQRVVTSEQIGKTAGEVWKVLADQDEQSLAALKKSIDAPGDMVLAAVGWLAREDKLRFTARGRSVKVSLRL